MKSLYTIFPEIDSRKQKNPVVIFIGMRYNGGNHSTKNAQKAPLCKGSWQKSLIFA
jgi:hypothetical protein